MKRPVRMNGPTGRLDAPAATPEPERSGSPVERIALRLDEVAQALGVGRRKIERERADGRFPPPDVVIGRMPLWQPATIRRWVEGGGR